MGSEETRTEGVDYTLQATKCERTGVGEVVIWEIGSFEGDAVKNFSIMDSGGEEEGGGCEEHDSGDAESQAVKAS